MAGAAAVLLVLALAGTWGWRARNASTSALMSRLPTRDAVVVAVDFAALRHAGVLQMLAPPAAGEPEYRSFVSRTAFDYQRDLDFALLAFAPHARYFLLRGRFDWKALRTYAEAEHGSCQDSLCRMAGSVPDRRISYFPVQTGVMALAVGPDPYAALALGTRDASAVAETPDAPLWISLPQAVLRSGDGLPAGTRMFVRGMGNAESATISLGPDGLRFAARLTVRCRDAQDAAAVAEQLTKTTTLLRDLIEREHKRPNASDLSGVLTSGAFRSEGARVFGYWPIERSFLDNLLAGNS